MPIISVPEYGFSVNTEYLLSVQVDNNTAYSKGDWQLVANYTTGDANSNVLYISNKEEDVRHAHQLLMERIPE